MRTTALQKLRIKTAEPQCFASNPDAAIYFSILAWRILWTEEPGRLWPDRITESNTTEVH